MAEYYHVYELDRLPVSTLAALAAGLPPYSRSKRKYSGQTVPDGTGLLALILDSINHIGWMLSKDGEKGRNHPKSVYEILTGTDRENDVVGYLTPDDFETARNRILMEGGYLS